MLMAMAKKLDDLVDELKKPEYLLSYCERFLGSASRKGGAMVFPCPFGSHRRKHLEISEHQGQGRYVCWACDERGSIFDLYAHQQGMNVKTEFSDVVRGVAEAVGVTYSGVFDAEGKKPSRKRKKLSVKRPVVKPMPIPELEIKGISLEDTQALNECCDFLGEDRQWQEIVAEFFGVSQMTIARLAWEGSLGVSPLGRVIYIYRADDAEGNTVIVCAKIRYKGCSSVGISADGKPLYRTEEIIDGRLKKSKKGKDLTTAPYKVLVGKPSVPWRWWLVERSGCVAITEGESDAMAVYQTMEELKEADPSMAEYLPIVVGISGTGGLNRGLDLLLRGKLVYLALDSDEAGQKATLEIKERLEEAGAKVRYWQNPDADSKDCREYLNRHGAEALGQSLMEQWIFNN